MDGIPIYVDLLGLLALFISSSCGIGFLAGFTQNHLHGRTLCDSFAGEVPLA